EGARESDVETAARNAVEHADLAGELEGIVEHRQHRAGYKTHGLGALRSGAQENDRVGAVTAVAVEIMLDRARVAITQLVRFFRNHERLGVVVDGALVGMVDRRKELHTELHVAPCSRSLAWNSGDGGDAAHYRAACLPVNRTGRPGVSASERFSGAPD